MVICCSSHGKWMQRGICQRHCCCFLFSGFMWGHQPSQEEMYLSGLSDNALFPKYLLIDMSQNRELQKCTNLSLSPIPLQSTYKLKIMLKITHRIFLYEVIKRDTNHKLTWGHGIIQVLCGCKLIQLGGVLFKRKNRNLRWNWICI